MYLSTTNMGLTLLLLLNLGGLVLDLTSTSKRTVDLTTTNETESESKGGFLLDVAFSKSAFVGKFLTTENEALSFSSNTLFSSNHSLDSFNLGGGFNGIRINSYKI